MTEHTLVHEAGRNHDVLVSTYITDASTPSQQTIVTMEYAKLLCSELRGTSFIYLFIPVCIQRLGGLHMRRRA